MRKVGYSLIPLLLVAFLAAPAWAQKGGRGRGGGRKATAQVKPSPGGTSVRTPASSERSNKGGEVRGLQRAEQVQQMSKQGDANRDITVAPGVEKAQERQSIRQRAEQGKGATKGVKTRTRQSEDKDPDESKD